MVVRELAPGDIPYALASWRESHKQSPGSDKVPWGYYKNTFGVLFRALLEDPSTVTLGAYNVNNVLLGFLVMTPGKRVNALHWVQTKFKIGEDKIRRHGVMAHLLEAANLGNRFVYTLQAARRKTKLPDGTLTRSFDEVLAAKLREQGTTAVYVPLQEWIK